MGALVAMLEVLFPRRCAGCGSGPWPLCPSCRSLVATLAPPGCRRCGRPLEHEVERCADCPPAVLSWSRSAFLYEGPVRRSLMRLKFGGVRSAVELFAPPMAHLLASAPWAGVGEEPAERSPPVLTWVPLGAARRRRRGYDQAEALARRVASIGGFRAARLLRREVETAPQARRSGAERQSGVRGAFRAISAAPWGVVIVDDVLTTGATAAECALALRAAGARAVGLLTAARAIGGAIPARCYNPAGPEPGSVVAREIASR